MELSFIILALLFVIKHFLADFVLQSKAMVEEKGSYGALPGIHHSYIHGLLTAFILLPVAPMLMAAIKLGFIDFLIHYHVDWAKQKISKKYTTADKEFWFWLGLDQMLHYITYIGIIAWVMLIT